MLLVLRKTSVIIYHANDG